MTETEAPERPSFFHLMWNVVDPAGVSVAQRDRIAQRYTQAWWYASGIDDREGTHHADAFAYSHGIDSFLYESGQTHMLRSIQGAYKDFRKDS